MSQPDPIGAIGQILNASRDNPADKLGWHTFEIKPAVPTGRSAGQWCMTNIIGDWTFKAEYGAMTFYIKEKADAMLFKLTWGGK